MAVKSNHLPVHIKTEVHQSMKAYAELFGAPINRIAEEAIGDWMATVGRARMEAILALSGKTLLTNLIHMPAPGAAHGDCATAPAAMPSIGQNPGMPGETSGTPAS